MMNDSIRELMDSCRPDREDDLRQPEMQPLAELIARDKQAAAQLERSQTLDTAIADAVQDVPIPDGLKQRLLAGLSADGLAETKQDIEACPEAALAADVATARRRSLAGSWRMWTALASCAAVVALIPVLAPWRQIEEVGQQELVQAAMTWSPSDNGWTAGKELWEKYPLPSSTFAKGVGLKGGKMVRLTRYDVNAACYELALADRSMARVYVIDDPRFVVPPSPPRAPAFTLGKSVAAWSSGKLVYVLVFDGPEKDYRRWIQQTLQMARALRDGGRATPIRTV